MNLVEISTSKIKGQRGVAIGLESLFLALELKGETWSAKLIDLHNPPIFTTSWVAIKPLNKLYSSPKAKFIRDGIKERFNDDWQKTVDNIISLVQDNIEDWQPIEEETQPKKEKEPLTALSAEESEMVQQIFLCKKPLDALTPLFDDLIAGEEANKKLFFTLCSSGKSKNPKEKDIILIKSTAGAGKTTLVNAILKCYRTKKVGRFTKTALDHSDLEGYEILYLQEIGHMDDESQGVSTLKFLSADDQGYTVEITMGSPSEGFTTITKKIPPMTVVSSTTRVEIDPQFERRCWIINLDESMEQTKRIKEFNSRVEMEKTEIALGIRNELSSERTTRILKWVVDGIPEAEVSILFPNALQNVLAENKIRSRGDYNKLLRLLKYYTRLCHILVPQTKTRKNKPLLFPTPRTALDILEVAWGPIKLMTSGLDKRTQKLIDAFEMNNIREKGDSINPKLRAVLANSVGYAPNTIRQYLNNMESVGYLSSDGKKPKTYFLLASIETIKLKSSALSLNHENEDDYMGEMLKEARSNLGMLSLKLPEGTLRDICVCVREEQSFFNDSDLGTSEPPLQEINPNNPQNNEITIPHTTRRGVQGKLESPVNLMDIERREENMSPVAPSNLQERVAEGLKILGEVEKAIGGEAVEFSKIVSEFVSMGWEESEVVRVFEILKRDGLIYEPRPRFIKMCIS